MQGEIGMLSVILLTGMTLYTVALYLIYKKRLIVRIQALERNLQAFSDVMSKMAEAQTETIQKFSSKIENLEECIIDFSSSSQDAKHPLERRHQVLSLARQGIPLADIAKRLKAPVGEAELILNLNKYVNGKCRPSAKREEEGSPFLNLKKYPDGEGRSSAKRNEQVSSYV
jgi:hypothetical protein